MRTPARHCACTAQAGGYFSRSEQPHNLEFIYAPYPHGWYLLLVLTASPAFSATYYVSLQGNDSNACYTAQSSSQSQQKRSIAGALECLTAGDTLYIHGGTYTGWRNVIDSQMHHVPSGTSFSNPITIAGFPGEQVTLQPPYNYPGIRLTTGAPHHLIFQDFAIDLVNSTPGADATGIFLAAAHHIRFQRLDISRSPAFGVHFAETSPSNEMLNCRIHDNGYYGDTAINGHGLYISSSSNVFDGNEVYNNQGYGFHIYNNWGSHDTPSYNVVKNNKVYGNGIHGTPAYGILFAWGTGNAAYDNEVYNNAGGVQIYTFANSTSIYNNSIYGNLAEGIALQYYGAGTMIRDNSVYSNGLNIADYGGLFGPASILNNLLRRP